MDDPTKALQLLRRWLADSQSDDYNDADPDTMRLRYETQIFLGVDVDQSWAGLAELAPE